MLITRFLEKYEYVRTQKLFRECFGNDEEYISELYGELDGENECTGTIRSHVIAVIENMSGEILSMVHYKPMIAMYGAEQVKVGYIMDVATKKDFRHRGMMDELMAAVEERLKAEGDPWCFLVPVDKEIYRHLGYVHDWSFNKGEGDLLDADEGLKDCSAKLLSEGEFIKPDRLFDIGQP